MRKLNLGLKLFFFRNFQKKGPVEKLSGILGPISVDSHRPSQKKGDRIYRMQLVEGFLVYTTWKVDGATPMYWFIMAPN